MKKQIIAMVSMVITAIGASPVAGQGIDEERMTRDIEVAENVLSTLIKQQLENQRVYFPLEIEGSYQPGYGVTFRLPADYTVPVVFSIAGADNIVNFTNPPTPPGADAFEYRYEIDRQRNQDQGTAVAGDLRLFRERSVERTQLDLDSIRDLYSLRMIDAAQTFLVDYGDMVTQLPPQEKIIISNQNNERRWVGRYFNAPKQRHITLEATKSDLTQYRLGKISREQALSKIKVINTETVEDVEPDLELLSSIFGRLYSQDLSKTYFAGDHIYFEHLKDYGVIYYMKVYSGIERGDFSRRYIMPTLALTDVDQETRDKKVKELYPVFELELKDNILEYGRTVKSLDDDEELVFRVNMTKCTGCDIPSSLELSIKASVLKEFNAGKIDRKAATAKFAAKKGQNQ
jgi:hypothetical protein